MNWSVVQDICAYIIIGFIVVMLAHECIKWFFGFNEISEKMDKIIKLLEEEKI